MRKTVVILLGLFGFMNFLSAQGKDLVAEGASPVFYITHTIAPKENYYSLGRMYNVAPKELAPFNNLDFEKGLSLGHAIKIPLTQNNFIQNGGAKTNEALVPVYHVVEAKEGLYRVSVNYKVPLEHLKKWNHLSSDAVSSGTKLVVGYLKVSKQESPLAKNATNIENEVAAVKDDVQRTKKPDAPKEILPVVRSADTVKTDEPIIKEKPVVKDKITGASNTTSAIRTSINFNGGSFKNLYENQLRNKTSVTESGISGVFKSTSGWQDGKYYCFHNQAEPGTILKITNIANGKSIYAKVLDLIPDINQNSGLILHLSNSAAEELSVSGTRFDCSINYSK